MTRLTEGKLQITISDAIQAKKFDSGDEHGLTHCMKAVDFIVELSDRFLFIEIKDPQHPDSNEKERKEFVRGFLGDAMDQNLVYKYRDSFLYEWASGRAGKPVYYLLLIAMDELTERDLLHRTDALKQKIPLLGPGGTRWLRSIVTGCSVFNIAAWNKHFPNYPVKRLV